jgi:hypothetical protein
MQLAYERWTQGREVPTLGTNAGAEVLPFQTWRHFKEAFAPELVARAIKESERTVRRCADPFGGSGTTALTCQFLGVDPVIVEVNPYLADLIEAKLAQYDGAALTRDFGQVLRRVYSWKGVVDLDYLPPTFVEPGIGGRYIYSHVVAQRIASYDAAIRELDLPSHRKLFAALLGGLLIEVSNVVVSGKGRRYRQNWKERQSTADDVDERFRVRVENALREVVRYANRPTTSFTLLRGDCRSMIKQAPKVDLVVFSPPYPNSFDYTDVYNVELWMLGYLRTAESNRTLRGSTLTSHVQILRKYAAKPVGSPTLDKVSKKLHAATASLWSPWIPSMVDAYFSDITDVLLALAKRLYARGEVWAVVGDSLYANVRIPVAAIIGELASGAGFELVRSEAFRSMRSSAQQGFKAELQETLVVLRKIAG